MPGEPIGKPKVSGSLSGVIDPKSKISQGFLAEEVGEEYRFLVEDDGLRLSAANVKSPVSSCPSVGKQLAYVARSFRFDAPGLLAHATIGFATVRTRFVGDERTVMCVRASLENNGRSGAKALCVLTDLTNTPSDALTLPSSSSTEVKTSCTHLPDIIDGKGTIDNGFLVGRKKNVQSVTIRLVLAEPRV